jgi:hypothetical protein
MPPLYVRENRDAIHVSGDDFELCFDRASARLAALRHAGRDLLSAGPVTNLWRAPLDNDVAFTPVWRRAGLDRLERTVSELEVLRYSASLIAVELIEYLKRDDERLVATATVRWLIYGSGDMLLQHKFRSARGPISLPRLGLKLSVPRDLQHVEWFGAGPHETLCDRATGARTGRHRGTVEEQFVPYLHPQDSGTRTGVRWLTLADDDGVGLLFAGLPVFTFNVGRYEAGDIEAARHPHELTPRPWIVVNLDHRYCGTGNTALRAERLPQYRVELEEADWSIRIRPVDLSRTDPAEEARQQLLLPRTP